jgi:hypothetical protein
MAALFVQMTTLGLAVAASPLPVVAMLIILLSKRAYPGSITLAVSWVLGIVVALGISLYFSATIKAPRMGTDLPAEGVFLLLLGVGLVVMGVLARRGRQQAKAGATTPTWVNSVDHLSPWGAALVGFSNATTSPKNLAVAITAGKTIAGSGVGLEWTVALSLYYVTIASLSVVIPAAVYLVGGDRSADLLNRWRDYITAHAAVVMEIILYVLGIAMSAKGLYNLLS